MGKQTKMKNPNNHGLTGLKFFWAKAAHFLEHFLLNAKRINLVLRNIGGQNEINNMLAGYNVNLTQSNSHHHHCGPVVGLAEHGTAAQSTTSHSSSVFLAGEALHDSNDCFLRSWTALSKAGRMNVTCNKRPHQQNNNKKHHQ